MIGFFLGNGMPHFVFGAARKVFRSPFSQKSQPRTNVIWGLSNFLAASIIAWALIALSLYSSFALIALLVGYYLTVLMFGTGIQRFLNEPQKTSS
jgi:hypothetical protein